MPEIKVAIALSGGVDSAVAAALLKEQGFQVKAFFLNLFDSAHFRESEKRAKKIAGILKIPFFVVDLRKQFKREIIDYFIKELKKGRTPNPCVLCNRQIKIGLLLQKIKGKNIRFLATGHYARIKKGKLFQAGDKGKDQSYFLWMLKEKQLNNLFFPIGGYTKKEVKNLAKRFNLPVFSKESQEICFISRDLDEFLKENLYIKKGRIIDQKGEIIGQHNGLWFYTIGQRKAIGLSGGPYYVLAKDINKNNLIVTRNKKDLLSQELGLVKINFIGEKPCFPLKIKAKIRYGSKSVSSILDKNKLIFKQKQLAVTSGQSAVFYLKNQVLGGGIIK